MLLFPIIFKFSFAIWILHFSNQKISFSHYFRIPSSKKQSSQTPVKPSKNRYQHFPETGWSKCFPKNHRERETEPITGNVKCIQQQGLECLFLDGRQRHDQRRPLDTRSVVLAPMIKRCRAAVNTGVNSQNGFLHWGNDDCLEVRAERKCLDGLFERILLFLDWNLGIESVFG